MFFAGVWEANNAQNMVSIITTEANACVHQVHNRMPVILHPSEAIQWLHSENPDALMQLLKPYPSEEMECWTVSSRVNNARIDDPSLVIPEAGGTTFQTSIF